MKYHININQLVLAETKLDLIDAAILDYLTFYCNSQNHKIEEKRITIDNKKYTWINYGTLLEDMPLLRISTTHSLTPRFKKMEQEGFIKTKLGQYKRLYILLTDKIDSLFIKQESNFNNRLNDYQKSSKRLLNEASQKSFKRSNKYTSDKYTRDTVTREKTDLKKTLITKIPDLPISVEEKESSVDDMLRFLGDKHSAKFYQLVAAKVPRGKILESLAEVKADRPNNPAANFTYKMNRYALKNL